MMQEYFALRDFLKPNGEKAFEKGHRYMGYRDGDCLILIDDDGINYPVGIGVGFIIIKNPKDDEITYC